VQRSLKRAAFVTGRRKLEAEPVSNMSKRSLVWIVIVLVGALSTTGMLWSGFGSIHAVFTAAELQTQLNQKLPRTVLNVTIEHVG
jgi:hypothetical protein